MFEEVNKNVAEVLFLPFIQKVTSLHCVLNRAAGDDAFFWTMSIKNIDHFFYTVYVNERDGGDHKVCRFLHY